MIEVLEAGGRRGGKHFCEVACLRGFSAANSVHFNGLFYYLPSVDFNMEDNVTKYKSKLTVVFKNLSSVAEIIVHFIN